jgi:FkbM family methyltransferase
MNSLYPVGAGIFPLAEPLVGYRMRVEWRSSRAFVLGTHERQVVRVLLGIIEPGWVVLDLGAHVGYFALLLAKLVGANGTVIAFEPHLGNFRVLQENMRLNGCTNVVLENRAVAATSGTMSLKSNDQERLTYTASLVHGTTIGHVQAVCVDEYLSMTCQRAQFVIMDVEGVEAGVLSGMRSTLQRDLPILLLELHGFDQFGGSHPALEQLRSMNYTFEYLDVPGAQVHILARPIAVASDGGRAST